jgi:hypothetical protein
VLFAGDELLSDLFLHKEIENDILWEVEGKVQTLAALCHSTPPAVDRIVASLIPNFGLADFVFSPSFRSVNY